MNSTNPAPAPDAGDIRSAAERIQPFIHSTPLLTSRILSERAGIEVRLKCENLQRAGSFKIRGATNALLNLTEEQRRAGVVAFSSGNHAQGVALAARLLGIRATIVMPQGAVRSKVEATQGYGAEVVQAGVTESTRGETAEKLARERSAALIPPFNNPHIIAGAGTVGLEIAQQWPEVRSIIVPLGGGGLLAGVALAAKSIDSRIEVFGVEPLAGNDGERSFKSGSIVRIDPPKTIADGARTTALGELNFSIIRDHVADIVSVDDATLLEILRFTIYRTKLLIEPTGCLGVAALLSGKLQPKGPVAIVLSGGNLDFSLLAT